MHLNKPFHISINHDRVVEPDTVAKAITKVITGNIDGLFISPFALAELNHDIGSRAFQSLTQLR